MSPPACTGSWTRTIERRLTPLLAAVALTAASCGGDTAFSLDVGDCFQDPDSFDTVAAVEFVDCEEPHDNEVYMVRRYTATDDYPGDRAMEEAAYRLCLSGFQDFVGTPYATSRYDIAALWPTAESWAKLNDREIVCAVFDVAGEPLAGSARDSGS